MPKKIVEEKIVFFFFFYRGQETLCAWDTKQTCSLATLEQGSGCRGDCVVRGQRLSKRI